MKWMARYRDNEEKSGRTVIKAFTRFMSNKKIERREEKNEK